MTTLACYEHPKLGLRSVIVKIGDIYVVQTNSVSQPDNFSSIENKALHFKTFKWAQRIALKIIGL